MNEQQFNNLNHHNSHHNNGSRHTQRHHTMYTLLGVGLVVLGALEVAFAFLSTIFSVLYLGIFFVMVGVFEALQALQLRGLRSFVVHALLSALYIVAGVFVIMDPVRNAIALTLLIAILLAAFGLAKIMCALMRCAMHNGWLLLDGAISLLLGALIWAQWPADSLWVIGMFVGINTAFTGMSWIMASSTVRTVE